MTREAINVPLPLTFGDVKRQAAMIGQPNDRPVEGHPPGSLVLRHVEGVLTDGTLTLTWGPAECPS